MERAKRDNRARTGPGMGSSLLVCVGRCQKKRGVSAKDRHTCDGKFVVW